MKLRDFSEADSQALTEISNEAFGDEIAREMPKFTPDGFVRYHEREGSRLVVAESDGRVTGFLVFTAMDETIPAQVHLVGVEKDLRGKGIGRRLLEFAIEHAKDSGKEKLRLYARPWNTAMRKVCANVGFIPEAYLRKEYLGEDLIQYSYFIE